MDRISHLPDDVLLKILSFLPTKDVMQTMLLSKHFKSLWMFVPRLEFNDITHSPKPQIVRASEPDYRIFRQFVDRSLMSFEGQVLQSLYLKLRGPFTDGDVMIWVRSALKRGLVELKLQYSYRCPLTHRLRFLPKSLYTSCEKLVVLQLEAIVLDVPELVCLRSLKTLSLKYVKFSNTSSLLSLLSNCPVLEDLSILCPYSNKNSGLIFKIVVPSLKRLYMIYYGITGLVICAPSLKHLHMVDHSGNFSVSESFNFSEVVKANIEVTKVTQPEKLLHALASAEHIHLCLPASKVVYPVGLCFPRLKRLEVCTCNTNWLDLFKHLLENSPSLKVIIISKCNHVTIHRYHWNPPGSVPRCLSSNLETLEWIKYEGTEEEKELSTYILKNAICLKKASFTATPIDPWRNLKMLKELSLSRRGSSTCQLVFK